MPIPFTCPHCGEQTTVADEYAGQTGPCGKCGKTIFVPGRSGAPAPGKSSTSVILIVMAIVGIGVLVCGGIMVAQWIPNVSAPRRAAQRASCINKMKQISLAMHNYHLDNGCFPPAYLPDENGEPMHSWRILILPYMEQQHIYDQYNFDEPWDSPSNQMLADTVLPIYQCPSAIKSDPTITNYVALVGPNTVFPGAEPVKMEDILDGTSNTIMIVEVANSDINWLEPRDLNVDEIDMTISDPFGGGGIGSEHTGGVNVAFSDGSVHFFGDDTDAQTLENLIDRQDGNSVNHY